MYQEGHWRTNILLLKHLTVISADNDVMATLETLRIWWAKLEFTNVIKIIVVISIEGYYTFSTQLPLKCKQDVNSFNNHFQSKHSITKKWKNKKSMESVSHWSYFTYPSSSIAVEKLHTCLYVT